MAYEDLDDFSVGNAGSDTFDVVIPDLDPGKSFPVQFAWKYKDGSTGLYSTSYILNTPQIARPESTNIVAQWVANDRGVQLEITWDAPALANGFTAYLTGTPEGFSTTTVPFAHSLDKTKTQQKLIIPSQMIRDNFSGIFVTNLTGLLKTTYIDTSTTGATFVIPPYGDPLDGSAISDSSWKITQVDKGFSVTWDAIPTNGTYWETVVYKSSTINGTYTAVGSARNAPVFIEEINLVYIKIRHRLTTGKYSQYSNAKEGKAYIPIVFDVTPPNDVTVNSAVWSGDNIVINYTMPATDPASRFKITLVNGISSGDFYEYPGGQTGTHTITLYDQSLYQQFGERHSSFTGTFISIDAAENPTSGVSFSVAQKTNSLVNAVPDLTVTAISNGYIAEFVNVPAGVSYIEVYANTATFAPLDPITGTIASQYLVYSGLSPALVTDLTYTTKYIRARYYTISGQPSKWSAEKQTTPLDAGQLSVINNPVEIQTGGSILAGDSLTTGARLLLNQYGMFLYDYNAVSGAAPSTQIVGNGYYDSSGNFQPVNTLAPTFITQRAKIADWMIYPDRFENSLTATTGTYTGFAPSGSYAIWAGANSSNNTDTLAKFSVTHAGAVTARNISIIGGGTPTAKLIDAGPFFVQNNGYMEATDAKITGEVNANTGVFKGTVDVGTGSNPAGQLRITSGGGTILLGHGLTIEGAAAAGITATASGGATNFWVRASDGYLFSQYGKIGGWSIATDKLSAGGGASTVGLSTSGSYAIWAGEGTPSVNTPFSVTPGGQLRATGAIISGNITVTSGTIGNQTTGWLIDAAQLKSYGYPSGTSQLILDSQNGTISGGLISGTRIVSSSFELTNGSDYFKSDGTFSFGGGKIYGTSSSLNIAAGTNIQMNIASNDDGTAGDKTVNQAVGTGALTLGRAFFYGSNYNPQTGNGGSRFDTRYEFYLASGSYQGVDAFDAGDIWMQRE